MSTDSDRPQDVGRRHARRKREGDGDALVERYYATMRSELAELLDSLAPVPGDQGLGLVKMPDKRLSLAERTKVWDLAIKLGRELGSRIDPTPGPIAGQTPARRPPPPRGKVDYG